MPTSTERSRRRRARMTSAQRTAERSFYAQRRRNDLIETIAPDLCCAECEQGFASPSDLEVDHVDGRDWLIDRTSASVRAARYWREYHAGVALRALCKPCNGADGGAKRYGYRRSW